MHFHHVVIKTESGHFDLQLRHPGRYLDMSDTRQTACAIPSLQTFGFDRGSVPSRRYTSTCRSSTAEPRTSSCSRIVMLIHNPVFLCGSPPKWRNSQSAARHFKNTSPLGTAGPQKLEAWIRTRPRTLLVTCCMFRLLTDASSSLPSFKCGTAVPRAMAVVAFALVKNSSFDLKN